MVDYLKDLDHNAHGGFNAVDSSLATTVYNTLAPMIDALQATTAPNAPEPELVINGAAASATVTSTSATATTR